MVTDRVSTCGLLSIVSHFYPTYTFWFVMLIVLDIASHWFHVMRYDALNCRFCPVSVSCTRMLGGTCLDYFVLLSSSVTAHHKSKEALKHRNPLLQWYYSVYPLFGYCCVGTELFYVLLYILHFYPNETISQVRAPDS
jgi:CDP-diacylglycerol--inositol 3-phosphatidyltransferase